MSLAQQLAISTKPTLCLAGGQPDGRASLTEGVGARGSSGLTQVGTVRGSSDPRGWGKDSFWGRHRFAPVCSEAEQGRGWAGSRAGLQSRGGEAGAPPGQPSPPHHKSGCRRCPAGGRSCGSHRCHRHRRVPEPPPCVSLATACPAALPASLARVSAGGDPGRGGLGTWRGVSNSTSALNEDAGEEVR